MRNENRNVSDPNGTTIQDFRFADGTTLSYRELVGNGVLKSWR